MASQVHDLAFPRASDARAVAAAAAANLASLSRTVAHHVSESFRYKPSHEDRRRAHAQHSALHVEHRAAADALRDAVFAYTARLRDAGMPPERTLVAVKSVVRDGLAVTSKVLDVDEVVSLAASWCIAAYYSPTKDRS